MDPRSRVLIVDDEPSGRELLEDLLTPQGYELALAANGAEALQTAAEWMPDVVLLDVMMPGMDGYEVCRSLRANPLLAEVPIIMLTALDDRDSRIYGLEAGADEFLTRPIDRGELRTRIRTITRLNRYRRLNLERSKFDQVVEFAPDGILIIDTDTTIGLANPAMHHVLRAAEHSLIGQKLQTFVAARQRQHFEETLRTVLANPAAVLSLETEFIRLSGETFTAAITARYFSWDGKPAAQVHVRDVTEQKELESQFLRAQRLQSIGTLVGGIAHDLNNVLTPVLVAAQLLREGSTGPERERLLSTVERSARRGAEIIRQILGFARGIDGGAQKSVDLRHLVSEMEKIAHDTFPRSIQIKSKARLGLWPVLGDTTQLHQVLMNLCLNARDAMPDGGSLKIEAENFSVTEDLARAHPDAVVGRYVKLSVADTGVGIAKEHLQKLFDPFFSTKETGKGTGLGLTTATGIVKNHNGFVTVESEVGRGSRFSVYLPAHEQSAKSTAESPASSFPKGQGELILIVDDEPSIREIIEATLVRFGYRVLTAADGAEAVAVYAKNQPEISLVLTDAMMPFLDGPALVRALQKLNPDVKVMGMSGLMEVDKMEELFDATTLSFLVKPFSSEGLLKSLHQALSGIQPEAD